MKHDATASSSGRASTSLVARGVEHQAAGDRVVSCSYTMDRATTYKQYELFIVLVWRELMMCSKKKTTCGTCGRTKRTADGSQSGTLFSVFFHVCVFYNDDPRHIVISFRCAAPPRNANYAWIDR